MPPIIFVGYGRSLEGGRANNVIFSSSQRAIGKRVIRFTPHDDDLPPSHELEEMHIVRTFPRNFAVLAYDSVRSHTGYNFDLHG